MAPQDTEARKAKIAGNTFEPVGETAQEFGDRLAAARGQSGVVVDLVSESALRFDEGHQLDAVAALAADPYMTTRLSWIIDTLGPSGPNLLTNEGIATIQTVALWPAEHEVERATLEAAFKALEEIRDIVEAQKNLDGQFVRFDPNEPRDVNLARQIYDLSNDWAGWGVGNPGLWKKDLAHPEVEAAKDDQTIVQQANEQLELLTGVPGALRDAYEILHPGDIKGKESIPGMTFQIAPSLGVAATQEAIATGSQNWVLPTPPTQNLSGPGMGL